MGRKIDEAMEIIEASRGTIEADMLIKNVRVADLFTRTVYPAEILIKHGVIAALNPNFTAKAKKEIDGKGAVALPGFIDSHVHIETTLLTPEALSEVIVPWGTTTMCVDAMEIANVAGVEGLRILIAQKQDLAYRMFIEVPSRVPTAPGLETTGGVMGPAEVADIMREGNTVSLGELDPSKVNPPLQEYIEKIIAAKEMGKICNGHAIGQNWQDLNTYAAAGLSDCHETVEVEELINKMRLGLKIIVREGSTERNVEALVKGILEHNLPTDTMMFCTDDKHVNDIKSEGHISYNIQKSIDLGLSPFDAVRMATVNAARHFRIDHLLGTVTPGKYADIVLVPEMDKIVPEMVLKGGEVVAEKGSAVSVQEKGSYPDTLMDTVHVSPSLSKKSFALSAEGERVQVKTINIYTDQILNFQSIEELSVEDGEVKPDIEKDILKIAVIERYGKTGNVGVGFIKGFGLKEGALASSVSHDHHNIVVVGTNDKDIYQAAVELEKSKGGFCAVRKGKVEGILPLPLGGLMSLEDSEKVMAHMIEINRKAQSMGCGLPSPFMTLSFVSLPTVPELGLTDMGLIDVKNHRIIDLIV